MEAASLRPLGIGEILDVAIKVYRSRFKMLLTAVAVVIAPFAILTAVVQVSSSPDDDIATETQQLDGTTDVEVDGGELAVAIGGFAVVGLLGLVSTQLATAASIKIVAGAYLGEEPTWQDSLRFAAGRLRSLIWLAILTSVLLIIGFILCIVPGVYFYVAWALSTAVLLLEDVRGRKALGRSRQLVRGRWWPLAVVLLLSSLLSAVVGFALSVPVVLLLFSSSDAVATIGQVVANTAGTILVTPFTAAVIVIAYFDMRVRKEGFDLELLARHLGVDPTDVGPGQIAPTTAMPPPPAPGAGSSGNGSEPPYWPPPPGWKPPDA